MNTVFIHTNNKQVFGAFVSRYSLRKNSAHPEVFEVKFLNVDESALFRDFAGKQYLRDGRLVTYDPEDLQSFTLIKFIVPELMGYKERAVLVDPDVFSVRGDINELLTMDLEGKALAARRKKEAYDPSVLVMDCAKLTHWRMKDFLDRLERREIDYADLMGLKLESSVLELPVQWNTYDAIEPETQLIHTTKRLTQPWKTGLPIDFVVNPNRLPKIFGIIPREPVLKFLGRIPTHYQPHPRKEVELFFIQLVKSARDAGEISETLIRSEIEKKHIRPDLLDLIQLSP